MVDDGYVEFEIVGKQNYLGEKSHHRGANATSIDALMVGRKRDGGNCLVMIEWKYTEKYASDDKYIPARAKIYDRLIMDPESPIRVNNPQHLYFEPYYQLMRQCLLGWRMTMKREYGCDEYLHVHVIPEGNHELRQTTPRVWRQFDVGGMEKRSQAAGALRWSRRIALQRREISDAGRSLTAYPRRVIGDTENERTNDPNLHHHHRSDDQLTPRHPRAREVVVSFHSGKKPRVKVTLNGFSYRTTVAAYGDVFMLPLSQERRAAAGVKAGDTVQVTLELDTEPRVVEVPDDLAKALEIGDVSEAFERSSYTARKEFARLVESAKAPNTHAAHHQDRQ